MEDEGIKSGFWITIRRNRAYRYARRTFRIISGLVISLFVLLIVNTVLTLLTPVEYQKLEIGNFTVSKGHGGERACQKARLPNHWKMSVKNSKKNGEMHNPFGSNYNRELVANTFAEYAALAANTYQPKETPYFMPLELPGKWDLKERRTTLGGLLVDFYTTKEPRRPKIAVVFRGTDPSSIVDWLTNASWLIGAINPLDQYRSARTITKEVIEKLAKDGTLASTAGDVSIVAVGHSLGGALARHVSLAFPCITAVSFNGSPLSNRHQLQYPYNPQFIEIFEDLDILSRIYHSFFPHRTADVSTRWQYYRMNNIEKAHGLGNHSMTKTSTAMARMVVMCRKRGDCEIKAKDDQASRIWCKAIDTKVVDGLDLDICPSELRSD